MTFLKHGSKEQGRDDAPETQGSNFPETVIAVGRKRPPRYVPHEPFPDTVKASLEPQGKRGGRRWIVVVVVLCAAAATALGGWAIHRFW